MSRRPSPSRPSSGAGGRDDDWFPEDTWQHDPLWQRARLVALKRDRFLCCQCGLPADDVHHRFALQQGGRLDDPHRHSPERIVTVCRDWHRWVHTHPLAAKGPGYVIDTAGLSLRPAEEIRAVIEATPIAMWTGVMTLSHDGRMSPLTVRYR